MKFNPPYFVAEISANHCGEFKTAKKLIKTAKINGADAVKLQTYTADTMTIKSNKKYFKVKNGLWKGYGLWDLYNKAHTPLSWHKELFLYAKKLGITIFSTPFDETAVTFLEKLNCPFYKVASSDITFTQLIRKIADTGKPVIISTGYASFEDMDRVLNTVDFKNNVAFLQCTSSYPANQKEINLNVIPEMIKRYPKNIIGYSGHDSGIIVSVLAYLLGARIVEKHFTLGRSLKGTDHAMSLEPEGLSKMCNGFKKAKDSLGVNLKKKMDYEKKFITKMKKSIVAKTDLAKDHPLALENLDFKSPGVGLDPFEADKLIGKKLKRNLKKDDYIMFEDLI